MSEAERCDNAFSPRERNYQQKRKVRKRTFGGLAHAQYVHFFVFAVRRMSLLRPGVVKQLTHSLVFAVLDTHSLWFSY